MATGLANLTAGGGDPRRPSVVSVDGREVPVDPGAAFSGTQKLHDPSISFEEYLYYAKLTRADERFEELNPDYRLFGVTLKKNRHGGESVGQHLAQIMGAEPVVQSQPGNQEKTIEGNPPGYAAGDEKLEIDSQNSQTRAVISDDEYATASRALRTAGWSSIFFLITTDILGPFNVPTAFAYLGYGPGVVLYSVFGFFAAYGGFLLWKLFLGLDSHRYPVRLFGDLAYRIYGPWARHVCNIVQFIQLFFNVAIIIVQNGLSLEQIVTGSGANSVCFIILCFVWAIAGMLLGQIRTLRNIGWIANLSVWLNVFVIIMIMAVVPRSPPNYQAAIAAVGPILGYDSIEPIQTHAGPPPGTNFTVQVEGLGLAIFAFGGAILFVELMAEMKRPFDFWKGMICAQVFIYFFYMMFGIFTYTFQGQYTINPAYQSISPYTWQTVGNSLEIITSLIAAMLYGNIGAKVVYNSILMDMFGFPDLSTRVGKIAWVVVVPVFWGAAFVVGAAIPQVTNLSALLAAIAIIQFSYTFPPFLMLGYLIKRDAMLPEDGFNPATKEVVRGDTGIKRYWRGYKKHWALNSWHIFFFLGSAVTCVLGIYSAIVGIITSYSSGSSSTFSCANPYA